MIPPDQFRRRTLAALVAMAGAVFATAVTAQDWPTKPIRMIVPYPPAGGTDVVARVLTEPLAAELGQPIVIENKGGAAGNLGTDIAAKATPDGYTFLFTLSSHTINPKLYDKLPFDVERDFVPIGRAASIPQLIAVHPSVKANSIQELNAAFVKVLQMPDVRDKLLLQGAEASPSTAAELDAVVKDELRKWEMVIRDAKIRPE